MAEPTEFVALMMNIADRITSAWYVFERLPNTEKRWLKTTCTAWPGMLPDRWIERAYAAETAREKQGHRQPPQATAKDISNAHEVLDWMVALAKQNREHARALQLYCGQRRKTKEVARIMGVGKTTAKRWRHEALHWLATHVSASRSTQG